MQVDEPTEAELCDVVVAQLRAQGWRAVCEIPFYGRRIDIVAVKGPTLLCVEVKRAFSAGLLKQARDCQVTSDWVFCAIGSNATPAVKAQVLNTGIGLWQIIGQEIITHQHSNPREPVAAYRQRMLAKCLNASETQRGGLPCTAQSGYMRGIAADVRAFKEQNPRATWSQIYEAIKSPYANAKNLRASISSYDFQQARKARRAGGSYTPII